MIQNKKLILLDIWRKNNLFSEFSISEIMDFFKKKTKTWVFLSLKLLVQRNLLISKRKGNLDLYSLNHNNPGCFIFLNYLEIQENIEFKYADLIGEIIQKSPQKNFCLIVFGSHAINKQKNDSDLDICFLVDSIEAIKKFKPYIADIKLDYPIKLDDNYISYKDFLVMLLSKEENLGKQIYKKHIIFYNAGIYYSLLKEAYENGFRG